MLTALLVNCGKTPVYPEVPEIEFKNIVRYGNGDSLLITLSFKDGDGDLGLGDEHNGPPYHNFDYVKNGSGNFVELNDSPANPPYNCYDYFIGDYNPDPPLDTVLLNRNENHYNYMIEYLIKQPDESFVKFNFEDSLCSSPHSRFPILSQNTGPIEGELNFKINMTDILLAPNNIYQKYFFNRYIKFRIFIKDRALNHSNTIETSEVLINF
jgi:hypothetical protein